MPLDRTGGSRRRRYDDAGPGGVEAAASSVADAINDGVTTIAPSQNAVFDALALKAPLASPTFTGDVVVPDADAATEAMNRQTSDARYERLFMHNVTIAPYSAVGDGTTDDAAAIQAALDAAETAGGGIVFLPEATYLIGTTLDVPTNVWLKGEGKCSILKATNAFNSVVVSSADTSEHARVSDLAVNGNVANQSNDAAIGIRLQGLAPIIERCVVYDTYGDGIRLHAALYGKILSCHAENIGKQGITLFGGTGAENQYCTVQHCTVKYSGQVTSEAALFAVGSPSLRCSFIGNVAYGGGNTETSGDGLSAYDPDHVDLLIEGNIFYDTGNHGTHVGGTNISVVGNKFHGFDLTGILYENDDVSVGGPVLIANNTVESSVTGSRGICVSNATDATVTGNVLSAPKEHGIKVELTDRFVVANNVVQDATNQGIRILKSRYGVVSGNFVNSAGDQGISLQDSGGLPAVTRVTVVGNTVMDCGGIGIRAIGSSTDSVIVGNVSKNNTGGDVSLATTVTGMVVDANSDNGVLATKAAAGTLTLPPGRPMLVQVTGNTNITSITATIPGDFVVLEFTGTPTVTDGSNLSLNGDFTAAAGSTLTLSCDGTNWYEVSRSPTPTGGSLTDGDKGDVTVSSSGATWTIDNDVVTFAKMQNLTTDRLLGRDTAGTGDTEQLTVGGGVEFTGSGGIQTSAFTGDVTKSAGGTATTIANDAVTYAKMQNVSATDKVLGRSTAGSGDVEEIACTAAGRALIDDADNTAQRTTLGLGSIATQAASSVTITGGSITGITDLAIADGGTAASTATAALTNLGVKRVVKASDESVNNGSTGATLQNDDELLFSIGASETWIVRFILGVDSPATGDFQCALTLPTSATMLVHVYGLAVAVSSLPVALQHTGTLTTSGTASARLGTFAGTIVPVVLEGVVINSTNAGNVTLQWAQFAADATNTTVKAGSYLQAIRVT